MHRALPIDFLDRVGHLLGASQIMAGTTEIMNLSNRDLDLDSTKGAIGPKDSEMP